MSQLSFALGIVLPLFMLMAVGFFARRGKFIDEAFSETSSRFSFRFCLTAYVFESLYNSNFREVFSLPLIGFGMTATLVAALGISLVAPLVTDSRPSRGSFIQGGFRGNYAFMALPIITSLFGAGGRAEAAVLVAFVMPLYNVLAVIVLSTHSRKAGRLRVGTVLASIATNPVILGALCAAPFAATGVRLPGFAEKFISYLSVMAVPLALIDIGSGMASRGGLSKLRIALIAVLYKIVATPIAFTLAGVLLGFRGQTLGIIFILGATPTAIASHPMARVMGCDADLAGDIVLLTTLGSAVTITAGISILRGAGLI